ncbi:enoyl-CoA hydratase [Parendozoicomonas haliclonae]|uniref:Putative enoyl-CoA hydratase echA8 n=1 Tax=Parendozoicomonas haliclonae TaxID=1960125 RepID=A0A1X7AEA6_9GAMM|nr:enoyl-CoA hydratase [Parendozoicomonas haliclonae]SMA32459.1 putative enoyl-CoA hydratase echA8 [Parendozoicomonas haliclonae]
MSEHVRSEVREATQIISINRPERKNALTHAMYDALSSAIISADSNPEIRTIILTGTTECFTAGNDLGDFLQNPPLGEDSPVSRFMVALLECTKPVIAAINGPAVGIGTTLLLHCDLVYAGLQSHLQTPFTRLGLCPEYASSLLMPQLLGHRKAFEMLVLGEPMGAEEALRTGLVNGIGDDYLEQAIARAAQIAQLPPASVRLGKKLMTSAQREEVRTMIKTEMAAFGERLTSEEAKEAFSAFAAKRAPDFSRFS